MREIIFRGYNHELKKWVYGHLINVPNWSSFIFDWKNNFEDRIMVDSDSVGLFTGLRDKNNVPIFEGDVTRDEEATYRIFWDNECSRFDCERLEDGSTMRSFGCYDHTILSDLILGSKVIGNIHEHPHLLNRS